MTKLRSNDPATSGSVPEFVSADVLPKICCECGGKLVYVENINEDTYTIAGDPIDDTRHSIVCLKCQQHTTGDAMLTVLASVGISP